MKKLEEYKGIVNDCKKIYMRFFYGDELTELEKDIETRYLVTKQSKYFKYLNSEVLKSLFYISFSRDPNINVYGLIPNKGDSNL